MLCNRCIHNGAVVALWLLVLVLGIGNAGAATSGRIKGVITDTATRDPVIGASVAVLGTTRGAMTDFDGKYVIGQMRPGTHLLRISHLDYRSLDVTVTVEANQTAQENVRLRRDMTGLSEKITIDSTVSIIDRNAVASLKTPNERASRQTVEPRDEPETEVAKATAPEGETMLLRGSDVKHTGYHVGDQPNAAPDSPSIPATGTIQGIVTDGETGRPLIGATVTLMGTDCVSSTDDCGSYRFVELPIRMYRLRVTHQPYQTVEVINVKVRPGADTRQNVSLGIGPYTTSDEIRLEATATGADR